MIYLKEGAGIGPCMDVKTHNGLLYAIQKENSMHRGRLCVLRPDLSLVSSFEGIGNARQIEIVGNTAVITARESGAWIFDVTEAEPRLCCHYQTVEYATGVALYGNLACISCRQYGVQLIDISEPIAPRHISIVRVGEVQSATVCDGILYCGVWGEMKVVVVDIRDAAHPTVLSEIPLQGRGDGVCVKDGVLYAATGQHARGIVNVSDHNDPAHGMGNGVECFDVSDPKSPVKLRGRLFEKAYNVSIDMWEAAVYGDTLVVNNSILGVYGMDPQTLEIKFNVRPSESEIPDAVTGVTALGGDLFVAAHNSDLFAVRGMGLGDQPRNREISVELCPTTFSYSGYGAELEVKYSGAFPVLAAAETDSAIALACSEGGVHLLDKETLEPLALLPTLGFAQDVRYLNGRLYVAEEFSGAEIFELCGTDAKRICHITDKKPIYQLAPSKSGNYLICALSSNELKTFDVSDTDAPKPIYSYTMRKGPLYGSNFASNTLEDGSIILFGHQDGLLYTNPDRGDRQFLNVEYKRRIGFCGYCAGEGIETDGKSILYTINGGYVLLSTEHPNLQLIDELPCYRPEEHFKGLLTLDGGRMIASQRSKGEIRLLDVSNLLAPKIKASLTTTASPAKAIAVNGRALVPGGRAGLLELIPKNQTRKVAYY